MSIRLDLRKTLVAIAIMVLSGLLEGISLLLLLPLLGFISATPNSGYGAKLFNFIHIHASLIETLVIYVIILTLFAGLNYCRSCYIGAMQLQFVYDLQQKLYGAFINSSWSRIAGTKRSDLNQLLTREISNVAYGVNMLVQLVSAFVLIFIYLVLSCLISWQLTLIALACGLFIYAALHFQTKTARAIGKNNYKFFQKLYSAINDHLLSAKLVKTYCLEKRMLQYFSNIAAEIVRQGSKFIAMQSLNAVIYTAGGALVFSVIFYYSATDFHIQLATLFVLLIIFARLIAKLSSFQQNYQSLVNTFASFKAVNDKTEYFLANQEAKISGTVPIKFKHEICLKNIGFAYDDEGRGKVITKLNLTIPANKITLIVGPSGSGKSTLVDIIIGLLKPQTGEILLDGKKLRKGQIAAWRDAIAYVPQDDCLLNDTIRNNLTLVTSTNIADSDIDDALQKANIFDMVQKLPQKLETLVGDDGLGLSGGEKQRILLARALLRKPQLLILDEATSALDVANETAIFETIKKLRDKLTVIIITHRPTLARMADQVIAMKGVLCEKSRKRL